MTFFVEAPLVRATRGARRAANLRAHEGGAHELGQTRAGAFEVLELRTGFVADDENAAVGVEAAVEGGVSAMLVNAPRETDAAT